MHRIGWGKAVVRCRAITVFIFPHTAREVPGCNIWILTQWNFMLYRAGMRAGLSPMYVTFDSWRYRYIALYYLVGGGKF